jgi:hypothetical protein
MRKIVWLLVNLLILSTIQTTFAAARLGPPVGELQKYPERIRIVVARAAAKVDSSGIQFSVDERLCGEAPDEVLLRVDEDTFADVTIGSSYVLAWTYLRRNRGVIGGWEEDPAGPSVVQVMGLGATALFEDTPQIRFLFSPASQAGIEGPGRQLDALLAQMQRSDYRSRGLVITELYLRPDLTEQMNPAQVELLKEVLQTQELEAQNHDFLLRAALRLPADQTSPWLAESFRKIIILHGTQYDLASYVPGLVRTAARGLQQTGAPPDIELLSILLYSNNPGVATAALDAMNQIDAGAAVIQAEKALGRGWIHSESRRAINRYLGQVRTDTPDA